MKVIRGRSSNPNQSATNPFPEKGWFFWEYRGGDFIQPQGKGDWFHPPYFPNGVEHKYFPEATELFVSWKIPFLGRQGYYGAKIFGVDSDAYKEWMCKPEEVYEGSQAIMKSARIGGVIPKIEIPK